MKLIIRILITMASLWVASRWVTGISTDGSVLALAGVALVFGIVNGFVRPILTLLSLPVVILTLGIFLLVINALMLMLTSALSNSLGLGFHVAGFGPALIGSIVISIVSTVLSMLLPDESVRGAPSN
jgi:putative membrane protein